MHENDLFNVQGKVVCVTGASSGLGRHAASVLAKSGAYVVGIARRFEELSNLQKEVGSNLSVISFDLTQLDRIEKLAGKISQSFGSPDILINAAAINTRETADDVLKDSWDKTIALNLSAPFFLSKILVKEMKRKKWGRIINIASVQSMRAFPGGIAYGTTKGGIAQMTRAMAESWSKSGVNANALVPGFVKTELTAEVFNDTARANRNAAQTCIGRNGKLSDFNGPLIFLSSNASSFMTGQLLTVDGGFTAK